MVLNLVFFPFFPMRENDARMVKIMFLVNINQNRCSRSYKTVESSNTCKIYTFDLVKTMGNQKLDFFFTLFTLEIEFVIWN